MSTNIYKSPLLKLINKAKKKRFKYRANKTNSVSRIASPTAPTAIPFWKIILSLPSLFPRSFRNSFEDYKLYRSDPERIQDELLSTLNFYPTPHNGKSSKVIKTVIDDEGNYINEFCIMPNNVTAKEKDIKHLIFVHGYGAGMGFFLKNMEKIPLIENRWCIHYIDMPGFGFSSRNKFPFKYPQHDVKQVETWFQQNIHSWFKKRDLLKFPENNLVVAHSLGAYLMILYKNVFPNHFRKFVLCSPAGICQSNPNHNVKKPPWWYIKLWEQNVSPFSLVRNSFSLGSKLTSAWSYRRFKNLTEINQFEALHKYVYAIFNKQGCGEYLLAFILKCGGDPRLAIEERITSVKNSGHSDSEWLWLYGDNDWMDIAGGHRVSKYINKTGLGKSRVAVIPNAGHHLYLDNYDFFNSLIESEMKRFQS